MELFNQKKALDFILRTAQEKKVSQSKLVEGIYDYSHFNRMCNGKEKINMEVVLLCARKLDINLDELVRRSSDQDIAFSTLKNEFKFLTMIQNYEEILIFFEFIKGLSYEDNHFKQFKYRVEAILCGQLHHDYEKALEIFNKALRLTIKFTEILDIEFCYLSVEELTIINDIALCYDALNSKKAILLMETVLKSIGKNDFLINDCFRFYYNLGLMYSHHKDYIKMESISLEGIKKCLKSNEFITLAYLYYNHFIASYLLNNIDMALEELNNSYVLFKMQGKTKAITDVLLTDIQKYQMNIQLSDIKSYGE